MPFTFQKTELEDLMIIQPEVFADNRGFFTETYKKSEFEKNGILGEFNQDNQSKSTKGVLRGLHFQKEPYAQAKLVRCIRGRIYDVAVDLRKNSITFGKYLKVELSEENKKQIYIPKGFAHGFVILSDTAEICYKTQGEYNLQTDCGVFWADKDLAIDWGIDFEPILSEKDKKQQSLKEFLEAKE